MKLFLYYWLHHPLALFESIQHKARCLYLTTSWNFLSLGQRVRLAVYIFVDTGFFLWCDWKQPFWQGLATCHDDSNNQWTWRISISNLKDLPILLGCLYSKLLKLWSFLARSIFVCSRRDKWHSFSAERDLFKSAIKTTIGPLLHNISKH